MASATDASAWDAFAAGAEGATFFHRFAWKALLSNALGYEPHYLCAFADGRLCGILPLMHVRSPLFGATLTSLPFCSYAGALAIDDVTRDALIAEAVRLGTRLGVRHVELRNTLPQQPHVPRQDLYFTFRAPIPADLESMKGIPQKRRNVVRRAVSMGLRSEVGRDADRFFELYAENARAHGTPALGRRFFGMLLDAFPQDADVVYVMDAKGRDLSAILNFYHQAEVLAYFAGENASARETNANDFKYWSLMKHASSRGCTQFDFGRSKAGTGSFQFKRLWGFEPQQLHYEFPYLPSGVVPQNNPMNPKYRLAIETWRKLPRFVVDRVGPILVTGLG
ncbi:MAG: FemAB family PEP-CTERM system-associated protein [Burkholderiales bacterium]|nr:FemAB family PEP-CTERM system-associated protein [Burkholderiales bacterium]